MNRLCIILFIMILIPFENYVYASQTAESGGMLWVSVEKRANKYFSAQMQNHVWLDNNFKSLERYMVFFDFKVTLLDKYLYFDALYFYRYQHSVSGNCRNTNRYQLGLSGGYKLPHIGFSAYSRFESDYIKVGAELPYNRLYWRNRLQINSYVNEKCKWQPYTALEIFNTMGWPIKNGIERLWIDLGSLYKINNMFSMDFKVREIMPMLDKENRKLSTYFGIGCQIRL